jgi:hypothetical protein
MMMPHACIALLLAFLTPAVAIADDAIFAPGCFEHPDLYFYSTDCGEVPEVGILDGALFENICVRVKAPDVTAKSGDGAAELASWGAVKALFR